MAFTDKIYEVNWNTLSVWFVQTFLRNQRILAFTAAMAAGVNGLHNRFITYKDYTAYWLEIDSQVWRMEKALNDKYDIVLRRIKIVDSIEMLATYLYKPEENKLQVLYKKGEAAGLVLYTKAETGIFTNDFIVAVPAEIGFSMNEMRAFIDAFKTPSKTYSVKTV